MSQRIDQLFSNFKKKGKKVLIGYVTAGFPHKESLLEIVPFLEKSGLQLLEVGVPFSDPIADGPTIQRASQIALQNGMTVHGVLEQVQALRSKVRMPIVLMSYCNPILAMGADEFFRAAEAAGVDGLIVPDLIPEEGHYFSGPAQRHHVDLIYLVTPTTPVNRLKTVAQLTQGFLYAVSLTGVTGARTELSPQVQGFLSRLKRVTDKPVAVGFGISTPKHVQAVRQFVDAVIVGSALLFEIEKSEQEHFLGAGQFVSRLQNALNSGPGLYSE